MIMLRNLLIMSVLLGICLSNGVYAQKSIKSASEYDYPPFSIVNEKGEADGFSVELLRATLKAIGLDVEFYVGPWTKIKQDLVIGKIQVLPLVGRTPEREKLYDFSVPYKTNYGAIFIRNDKKGINTLKDLADKEVLVMKGDNAEEFLVRENISKHIITTESFEEAFKMLSEGKHDAVVAQQIVGKQLIKKLDITNIIHKTRIDKYKQDWTFAVKEGDKKLLASLNDGLSTIITNGTFDIIHDKWFKTIEVDEKFKRLLTSKEKVFIDEHSEITIAHTFSKELITLAEQSIKQKAEDVARQVEIYLNAYPDKTLKELQNDPEFQRIAVQPVGKTGYTAISDYNKLVVLFHPNKKLVGIEIERMSKKYPVMWTLLKQAKDGYDTSGTYKFPDLNGVLKDKYLYIKIPAIKTADGVGMWVAATTYLDEYDKTEQIDKKKESFSKTPLFWILGVLLLAVIFLLTLDKLNIIKFEKNAIMLFLLIALLLLIGLFVFNAYNISKRLKKTAIENYYDTLRATASIKHLNIEQHISHAKGSFKIVSTRKDISNEDLRKIVDFGEDFIEVFRIDSSGKITHSSDLSHIGLSRLKDKYFINATEKIYIKPLYNSSTVGEILFTISAPYKEGVLVARMGLDHINDIVSKKEGLGKSGESLLAYRNKNGNAVFFTKRRFTADAGARDIIPKEDINIPITQALLGHEKEFSHYVDYRNAPVFAITKYIEELDAGLVVKVDQEEVFESILGNIKQIWYSTTTIIFAIIIIGIIFYFLLTYSLRREVNAKTGALEKASRGLDKALERLNLATHSAKIAIWDWDIKQNYMNWSDRAEEALGFISQAFGNNFEAYMKWVHPEDTDTINNQISQHLEKKHTKFQLEYRVIHTNGEICWISAPGEVFYNSSDEPIRIAGIMVDITARKQSEVEKNKLESRLQQSQKMESIGTLAGGIAHDFNNLLYPIIGFSEMLKEDLPQDSPEHDSAQEIFIAGRRGAELVKQILAFSRQTDHKLSPVYFQNILTEVIKLTRSTIPSDIDIDHDIQQDCGLLMAEATQLHQIAMNLITNAYHAVEKTSGRISIQLKEIILDNDDLKDSSLQPGQYAVLSVSDNGEGIPRDIVNNIFEPYFTTKEQGKGTGLGLAVVYGILTEHKGDIKVYSEVDKGTTFNIYLPLMKKSTGTVPIEKDLNTLTGTDRILLVDDEESVVRLEKLMLERLGYNVSAWSNSLEALETFRSNPGGYDLVISDMTMPNMTGAQLARELMSIRPDIPIIICTGFSERINKEQAEANKVKGFIMKPVIKHDMAQMVRKVLDEAKKN